MHQTFLQNPSHYTIAELPAALTRYSSTQWRPAFPTLHNTGVPSLAQWIGMGTTPQERWGASLNRYYTGLGWHAGPHFVVCPDYVWILCDPSQPGVSVSCWNAKTVGIEMVGNYEIGGDDFASGLGAKVRDNAVQVLALLADSFGWPELDEFKLGETGLHFHRECVRDHHLCPGSKVSKQDILDRVNRARCLADAVASAPEHRPDNISGSPSVVDQFDPMIKLMQSELRLLDSSSAVQVDGIFGSQTRSALISFQQKHGLADDWEPGSRTRALLSTLASHAT
jgi:peptidoglycan hydrolase-like protein with peptidoglycan-binding domain